MSSRHPQVAVREQHLVREKVSPSLPPLVYFVQVHHPFHLLCMHPGTKSLSAIVTVIIIIIIIVISGIEEPQW